MVETNVAVKLLRSGSKLHAWFGQPVELNPSIHTRHTTRNLLAVSAGSIYSVLAGLPLHRLSIFGGMFADDTFIHAALIVLLLFLVAAHQMNLGNDYHSSNWSEVRDNIELDIAKSSEKGEQANARQEAIREAQSTIDSVTNWRHTWAWRWYVLFPMTLAFLAISALVCSIVRLSIASSHTQEIAEFSCSLAKYAPRCL